MNKLYIQFGCGFQAPKTWKNYDASPTLLFEKIPFLGRLIKKNSQLFPANVLWGNIVKGLPIRENTVDGIFCSHVLEHLALSDFRIALKNTYKYLRKGGIFRLIVPDLYAAIDAYNRDQTDMAAIRFMENTLLGKKDRYHGIYGLIKALFGNSNHLWMWDEKSLRNELMNIGFKEIRRSSLGDSIDPAFNEVEKPDRFKDAVALEMRK